MVDTFLNENNIRNKDLREWNPRSEEQDVVITSSRIQLSQIFVSNVLIYISKSVHHDVVGILVVTCESSWGIAVGNP